MEKFTIKKELDSYKMFPDGEKWIWVGKMLSAEDIKELYPQQHKSPLNSKD